MKRLSSVIAAILLSYSPVALAKVSGAECAEEGRIKCPNAVWGLGLGVCLEKFADTSPACLNQIKLGQLIMDVDTAINFACRNDVKFYCGNLAGQKGAIPVCMERNMSNLSEWCQESRRQKASLKACLDAERPQQVTPDCMKTFTAILERYKKERVAWRNKVREQRAAAIKAKNAGIKVKSDPQAPAPAPAPPTPNPVK